MAEVIVERGGAVAGKGTLWAKMDNEGKNTISLKKAIFFALWVEAAMILGFVSIDFEKRWDDVKNSKIMKAIAPEAPPEEKKDEPPPPPKEIKKPEDKPKENVQEAAPIQVDAPAATSGSSSSVSVPQAVGDVSQGKGAMTDAPPPAVRSAASITNRKDCYSSFTYPREARRAGQQGEVMALVTVGPDGKPTNVVIQEANPRRVFDRVVQTTILSVCRFAPDPLGYLALVPVSFKLSGEGAE